MSLPKVTIVTVVYNDVAHLEKTMLSVFNQTYSNIEYIVIDGGSTDGTIDIIKKYSDRLAFLVSEKDNGIYDAMNKGIDHATGEWINFMNSGDYFYSDTVFSEVFKTENLESDLLYGSFIGVVSGVSVFHDAFEDVKHKSWQGMRVCHQALFARTDLMKRFKFNTKYRVSADGYFVAKCISMGLSFKKVPVTIFEVGTYGFSDKHWLLARKENWLIARNYFPGIRTDFAHAWGLVYFVTFGFLKRVLSAIGIYDFLRKYYRRWFGDRRMREKYNYKRIDNGKMV